MGNISYALSFAGMLTNAIELLILAILANSDMYGYKITKEISKTLEDYSFDIDTQRVYAILYKFEEMKLVSVTVEAAGERRTRKYYHLEPAGHKFLKNSWETYKGIDNEVVKAIDSLGVL